MTGKYFFDEVPVNLLAEKRSIGLIIYLSSGKKLIYCDARCFGAFYLQPRDAFRVSVPYKNLGPDALQEEISVDYLKNCFQTLKIPIKVALLEQKIISGIGNIYASEILFMAKINPLKPTNKLSREEIEKVLYHTKVILQKALELGGTSVVDFISPFGKGSYQQELKVYMRENKPCYQCQTTIIMERINNRSSFFCPHCQKLEL